MSAIKAILHLLSNNATLNAVVPASRISAGTLPQATAAPAIFIEHISTVRLQQVSGASGVCRSRVQVTVAAATYPSLHSTLDLVRAALPRSRGSHNGVVVDSILMDAEGPDFNDPDAGLFFGSQDVQVTWIEA